MARSDDRHTAGQMVDSPSTKCYLLAIPLELRLIIYDFYFSTFKLNRKTAIDNPNLVPALLHVCRLFREEALATYEACLEGYQSRVIEKFGEECGLNREPERLQIVHPSFPAFIGGLTPKRTSRYALAAVCQVEIQKIRKLRHTG